MLEDVTANCAAIHKYADTLATPGLLDPGADLALKIGQLVQADMGHLSTAIVRSIHGHYVTRDLSRKLQSVIYRGEPAVNFTAHLDQMFKEQALSSARHWQRIKKKIRLVAGVLSDCKNYHRPSVTRELRLHLGQQYGLVTLSTNKGRQIAVEIGEEVQLGSSTGTESTFELVNWVVALDSACASASDDIYGYIDACNTASAALDRMRQSLAG